jgi:uncharacterized membrane protein YdbT with pleckstrin-like domain
MDDGNFDLMPGERLVLFSHPHWWYFWKQVVGGIGVLILYLLANWASGGLATVLLWLTALTFIGWLADLIYEFIQWRTTRFAVTDQRVAYQSGFFRRKGVSIPLNRINNVNFEQSFIARLTGNGIVTIESAGETGDSVFENIPNPHHVRSVIFQQVEADEGADSERDAAAIARAMSGSAAAGTGATASVEDRLAQLERLRQTGAISDDEYAQKRSDILGSL